MLMVALTAAAAAAQTTKPIRTFAQFAGTWTLDESASTGRLTLAPLSLAIDTTRTEFHVTRTLRPERMMRPELASPPMEIYRLDGRVTTDSAPTVDAFERTRQFTLVADMPALTTTVHRLGDKAWTLQTDALELQGDTLKLHVQLISVSPDGEIYEMHEPSNNFKHTFTYRRTTPPRR